MFGPLQRSSNLTQDGKLGMQKLMSNPVVLSTIQTPHGKNTELWRVLCEETGNIWISGNNRIIHLLDQSGLILKTLSIYSNAFAFSLSLEKKLSFSVE